MDNLSQQEAELLGVDLGHGETAVALASASAVTEPRAVEIQGARTVVSAVAHTPDGRILIGDEAVVSNNIDTLRIGFKSPRLDDLEVRNTTAAFVRRLLELVRESGAVNPNVAARFLVGVPSGWGARTREIYELLLREAGMQPLTLMAESRAAFITAREERTLGVPDEVLSGSVLIIDIGSSTTDFTAVSALREQPVDHGHNQLGGSVLDKLILERALHSAADRDELEEIFRRAPWVRARCELACRRVKETWFSNEERFASEPAFVTVRIPSQPPRYFEPSLAKADVEEILRTPVASLGGRTWPEVFRASLDEYKTSAATRPPQLILLTGGASRMSFTAAICRAEFPDARVLRGTEPELAIAKGLAWAGRIDHKTAHFERDVENLLASGEIDARVSAGVEGLLDALADALAAALPDACVLPAFRDWRNGNVRTLNDLEGAIETRLDAWLKSTEGEGFLARAFARWFETLRPHIEQLTNPISDKYGIPRKVLGLPSFAELRPATGARLFDPVQIIGFEEFAVILNVLMSLIVATLFGGAGTALLMQGPVGWVIGLVVSFAVLYVGAERAKEHIRSADLPLLARKLIPQGRIESSLRDRGDELRAKIVETFRARSAEVETLRRAVAEAVRRDLGRSAEGARLLIR